MDLATRWTAAPTSLCGDGRANRGSEKLRRTGRQPFGLSQLKRDSFMHLAQRFRKFRSLAPPKPRQRQPLTLVEYLPRRATLAR